MTHARKWKVLIIGSLDAAIRRLVVIGKQNSSPGAIAVIHLLECSQRNFVGVETEGWVPLYCIMIQCAYVCVCLTVKTPVLVLYFEESLTKEKRARKALCFPPPEKATRDDPISETSLLPPQPLFKISLRPRFLFNLFMYLIDRIFNERRPHQTPCLNI